VESVKHGTVLRLLGCDLAQGYAIAKPMDAKAIETWLQTWEIPRSWVETKPLDALTLPLVYAIVEYRRWVRSICDYIANKSVKEPAVLGLEVLLAEHLDVLQSHQNIMEEFTQYHHRMMEKARMTLDAFKNDTLHNVQEELTALRDLRDSVIVHILPMIENKE
jgi:hypothetical protein